VVLEHQVRLLQADILETLHRYPASALRSHPKDCIWPCWASCPSPLQLAACRFQLVRQITTRPPHIWRMLCWHPLLKLGLLPNLGQAAVAARPGLLAGSRQLHGAGCN